jgi:hypothetical protein
MCGASFRVYDRGLRLLHREAAGTSRTIVLGAGRQVVMLPPFNPIV